jgi:hypothetical protein
MVSAPFLYWVGFNEIVKKFAKRHACQSRYPNSIFALAGSFAAMLKSIRRIFYETINSEGIFCVLLFI